MAHLALYREWRPQDFGSVVGQVPVIRTLQNTLSQQRVAHAYLFCGPRGTGKTSVAKIFAKALNCEQRAGVEPCNECHSCQRITNGSSMDVLEIDGASNRGIDEIRDLRDKVRFAPSEGRYKVYIIDEVHMLTTEAFNALLKTLEEPPAHVVFLLATTEPHKLPLTVLSRCQRFDFRRLSGSEITDRLRVVGAQLGLTVEEPAYELIARNSDGALRDALGLLEQCAAFSGTTITVPDILTLLGTVSDATKAALAGGILDRDTGQTLRLLHQVVNSGKDLKEFVLSMVNHYRNLLVARACGPDSGLLEVSGPDRDALLEQAQRYPEGLLLHCIDVLTETESSLRWATQPRVLVEAAVIRLCDFVPGGSLNELARRLERLEQTVAGRPADPVPEPVRRLVPVPPAAPAVGEQAAKPEATAATAAQVPIDTPAGDAGPEAIPPLNLLWVTGEWTKILDGIKKTKRSVHAFLVEGQPVQVDGDTLTINFKYPFHKEQIEKIENRQIVEQAIRNVLRTPLRVTCTADGPVPGGNSQAAAAVEPKPEEMDADTTIDTTLDIFGGQMVDID